MLPLHSAIENMNESLVSKLLAEGADPNEPDPSIGSARPLHISVDIECELACRENDASNIEATPAASITKQLLAAGADPNLLDGAGKSAISWAHERRHEQAMRLFNHAI